MKSKIFIKCCADCPFETDTSVVCYISTISMIENNKRTGNYLCYNRRI